MLIISSKSPYLYHVYLYKNFIPLARCVHWWKKSVHVNLFMIFMTHDLLMSLMSILSQHWQVHACKGLKLYDGNISSFVIGADLAPQLLL